MTERYCVYHVPGPQTPLCRLGSAALGRSIMGGEALAPPWPEGRGGEFPPHPARAALYGFHATLVAPFRSLVAPGVLTEAVAAAAAALEAVPLGPLELAILPPGFPALAPSAAPAALAGLESFLVRRFAGFRLPPSNDELARREPLTPRQRELARTWGYPFVMDEFRYHLTLGDCLQAPGLPPDPRSLRLLELLSGILGREDLDGLSVDALCLARQERAGAPFAAVHVSCLKPPAKVPCPGTPGTSPARSGPPSPAVRAGGDVAALVNPPGPVPGRAGFPEAGPK
ncbi:MAG: DUF1045 domain-containing protein [Deltaproteobacteria bacterium]|jgi:hypothetical protein|nr:DUF1045 domain-containing protein [Deltaproteobacteria bacterium]